MAGHRTFNEYEHEITNEDGFVYRVKRKADELSQVQAFQEPKRVVAKPKQSKPGDTTSRRKQRLPEIKGSFLKLEIDISPLTFESRQVRFFEEIARLANKFLEIQFADFKSTANQFQRLIESVLSHVSEVSKHHQLKVQSHALEATRIAQELEHVKSNDNLITHCFMYNSENLSTQEEVVQVEKLHLAGMEQLKRLESETKLRVPDPIPHKFEFPLELEMNEAVKKLVERNDQENLKTLMQVEACYNLAMEKERIREAIHLKALEAGREWVEDARDLICLR